MSEQEKLEHTEIVSEPQEITEDQEELAEVPTHEAAADVNEELKALKQDYEEMKDKHLRLYAEFENFKRRTTREKLEFMKTASQDILSALLPVLDDFDRAKQNAEKDGSTEVFSEGIRLVYHKLQHILKSKGLEAMDTTGQPFNPEFHEAVTEIPAASEEMKGHIIDTIEKGYLLNDKIIRYAKVVIGK